MSKSRGNMQYPQPIARTSGHRRAALFPVARNGVRPGRQLQPRRAADALQQRSSEWPRQSSQPHAGDDSSILRRSAPCAVRLAAVSQLVRSAGEVRPPRLRTSRYSATKNSNSRTRSNRIWELVARRRISFLPRKSRGRWRRIRRNRPSWAKSCLPRRRAFVIIVALAYPVLPHATEKIWEQPWQQGQTCRRRICMHLAWGALRPGTHVGEPEQLFPRVDKKETSERIEAMEEEIRNPSWSTAGCRATQRDAGGAGARLPRQPRLRPRTPKSASKISPKSKCASAW